MVPSSGLFDDDWLILFFYFGCFPCLLRNKDRERVHKSEGGGVGDRREAKRLGSAKWGVAGIIGKINLNASDARAVYLQGRSRSFMISFS